MQNFKVRTRTGNLTFTMDDTNIQSREVGYELMGCNKLACFIGTGNAVSN